MNIKQVEERHAELEELGYSPESADQIVKLEAAKEEDLKLEGISPQLIPARARDAAKREILAKQKRLAGLDATQAMECADNQIKHDQALAKRGEKVANYLP